MSSEIRTISLNGTNCYLVKTDSGFILIDTGFPFQRSSLEKELDRLGCRPGNLKLIVITHGDIDHTGNCAYLREKYQVKIAMHTGDTEMCMGDGITRDRGKMPADFPLLLLILWLMKGFVRFTFRRLLWGKPFERFEPDILLEEDHSLAEYGFDAKILYTPGHSKGSISIFNEDRDLICGDLLGVVWGRLLKSIEEGGLERLKAIKIRTVYPGHGKSFSMGQFIDS